MRTVIVGPRPPEIEALIARRQKLGLDRRDEVWEGDYHMNPSPAGPHAWVAAQLMYLLNPLADEVGLFVSADFNVGELRNFRCPDVGLHREPPIETWFPTAALVVEIESPGDESRDKFDFYASHGVDEVLIVSPEGRSTEWYRLGEVGYSPVAYSGLLGEGSASLIDRLRWPPQS